MLITRTSPFTGKIHTMDLPINESQLAAWRAGEMIQKAMPNLPASLREFVMTGITPQEWARFAPQEWDSMIGDQEN